MGGTITSIHYLGSPANLIPPGVSIDIIGVGFGSGPPAGATITFTEVGGSATVLTVTASSTGAAGQITSWVGNDITLTLPAAVNFTELGLHTWSIQVSSTVIGSSNVWGGTYFIPTITGITPNPALLGQVITISGTFNPTQLTMLLTWDAAANVITPTSWNATTITAVVPSNVPASFAGVSHEFGIWWPGTILIPPFNETQFAILVQGGPQITAVAPGQCAPGQTCEVVGNGFGATQGSTVLQLNGSNVTPTFWSNGLITFVVPSLTPVGAGTVTIAHTGFPTATGFFNVVPALALPGGTTGVQGQPVHITGSGFGATAGQLVYFSASGLTVVLTLTDWSDTSIFANIPANADLGAGTIWLILHGQTGESGIFGGFTIGQGFAGPQVTAFIPSVTWVTSPNVNAYPRVQYMQGNQLRFEAFPRGKIKKLTGDPSYDVEWLTQILPVAEFELVSAPSTDLAAIGPLTTSSINALGLIPPPPNLASVTALVLTPTSGMGGTLATVTVSGTAPQPTGTVTLSVDGTQINLGTLLSGTVSFNIPESAWGGVAGGHAVTADYLGDSLHLGSNNTQTFTFTVPVVLALPFVISYWVTSIGPLFIKDDGSETAYQTADVGNSSATVGIACTITNGSALVPTNGDLTPWFSTGTQIIFSADGTSTVYTVLSITSSQITLTGMYTGTSSSSFGSNVAYNLAQPTGTFQFKVDGSNFGTTVGLTGSPPNANSITGTGGTSPLTDGSHAPGGTYSGDSIWSTSGPNAPTAATDLGVYTVIPTMAISTALYGTFHVTNGLMAVTSTVDLRNVLGQGGQQLTFASAPSNHYTVATGTVTSVGFTLTANYTGTTATATTATMFTATLNDFQPLVLTATCSCSISGGPTPTGTVQFAQFSLGSWVNTDTLLDGGASVFALVHLSPNIATTFDFTTIVLPGMVIWFLDDDPSNYYLVTAVTSSQITIGSFNGGPSTYQGTNDSATDASIIALAVLTPVSAGVAQAQAIMPAESGPFLAGTPTYHFSYQFFTGDAHYNNSAFPAGGPPATAPNADMSFTFQTVPQLMPFVSDAWNVFRVRDDGGAAHQTANVTNSSATSGIGVTVTNGMPTVPTQFDLTPWFSNGQMIEFAAQPHVYYTIMTISMATITLTGNYTGTSSSSFGTTVAYRAQANPVGNWQFTVNGSNFGSLNYIDSTISLVSNTANGGSAPLTPDGNYSPGGSFTNGSVWANSGPNGPLASANLLVYSPTPSTSMSTLLLGTFSTTDGNTITATINQSTALASGGSDVAFPGQPATNYKVSSAPAPGTTFDLNTTYTGTLPFSGETASVTVVQVGSGQVIPLLGDTGCDEAPFGPTPTGTLTMWWYDVGTTSWVNVGSASLSPDINSFSRAQIVAPVGSPNPLDPPTGTPQHFTFSFASGDGNYNSIPTPSGTPPLSSPYPDFLFTFSGGS